MNEWRLIPPADWRWSAAAPDGRPNAHCQRPPWRIAEARVVDAPPRSREAFFRETLIARGAIRPRDPDAPTPMRDLPVGDTLRYTDPETREPAIYVVPRTLRLTDS